MIRLQLPATSANLGPGFDCMGLALDLWNTFELHVRGTPGTVRVENHGEGADWLPTGHENLILTTMLSKLDENDLPQDAGIEVVCHNQIPCASGLGSSSTATLAGLIFASALKARADLTGSRGGISALPLVRDKVNLDAVLKQAIEIEGHGDNVAPALLGGLILVVPNGDEPIVHRADLPPLRVSVCVPEYNFLTTTAREALPQAYAKADTIFNIGRALLVLEALGRGDDALLRAAMVDRVHEPYRLPLIPGAVQAKEAALAAGATAATLSGAGPGIIAFARQQHEAIGQAMVDAFAQHNLRARHWTLDSVSCGAKIESIS